MIIRIVKLTINPEQLNNFLSIYQSRMEKIREFDGCLYLELLQDKNSNILMTHSHWESHEKLETYRNSDFFKTTWKTVKPLFSDKPIAWSLTSKYKI